MKQIHDTKFTQTGHFKRVGVSVTRAVSVTCPVWSGFISFVGRALSLPYLQKRIFWTGFPPPPPGGQNSRTFETVISGKFFEPITLHRRVESTNICSGYETFENEETIVTSEHRLAI